MSRKYLLIATVILCLFAPPSGAQPDGAIALYSASFTDTQGRPFSLATLRGRVLVVNFWATWCGPCRDEIPELIRIHERYGPRGVEVVGIAVDESPGVREFAYAYGIDYPVATGFESGIALLKSLGNTVAGLPYTVVLDRAGHIIASHRGPMTEQRLAQILESALAHRISSEPSLTPHSRTLPP